MDGNASEFLDLFFRLRDLIHEHPGVCSRAPRFFSICGLRPAPRRRCVWSGAEDASPKSKKDGCVHG